MNLICKDQTKSQYKVFFEGAPPVNDSTFIDDFIHLGTQERSKEVLNFWESWVSVRSEKVRIGAEKVHIRAGKISIGAEKLRIGAQKLRSAYLLVECLADLCSKYSLTQLQYALSQLQYEQVSVSSGIGRTEGPKFEMPL